MQNNYLSKREIFEMLTAGRITAEEAYTMLKGRTGEREVTPEKASASSSLMYFTSEWGEAQETGLVECGSIKGYTLILDAGRELYDYLNKGTEMSGERLILVRPGNGYKEMGALEFEINPVEQEDYIKLLSTLKEKEILPENLVHLWTMDERAQDGDGMEGFAEGCLEKGVYSVMHIIKAFYTCHPKSLKKLLLVYKEGKDFLNPATYAMAGYTKSMGLIWPGLSVTAVQVAAGEAKDSIAEAVIRELGIPEGKAAPEVRIEAGKRQIKYMKPMEIKETSDSLLRKGGAYLITGGAGALGMIFAKYLREVYQARVVLVGRSALDGQKEKSLGKLEGWGRDVIYLSADISDLGEMKAVIDIVKQRFGELNGVLHAAGIASDKSILDKDIKDFERTLKPKIHGTMVLDEVTKEHPLDFFALFSSTSSVLGDFGQCDYAVSNRFLDIYALQREALFKENKRRGRTVAINWPLWREGGMHLNKGGETLYLQSSGMAFLETESGIKAFENILGNQASVIMAIVGDKKRVQRFLKINREEMGQMIEKKPERKHISEKASGSVSTKTAAIPGIPVEHRLEEDVRKLAAELLRIAPEKLDVTENLGDYGFDSIGLKEFADKLGRTYSIDIGPTVFFAHSNIKDLSDYLMQEFEGAVKSYYAVSEKETGTAETAASGHSYTNPVSTGLNRTAVHTRKAWRREVPSTRLKTPKMAEPVAIIGISGIFPKSKDLNEFWKNLEAQKNLVSEIPSDRWDWSEYYSETGAEKNKINSKWGGFISDVDKFDAKFYGISPREAELMDPQHRLFMQTVWKTIEDAGYKASQFSGKNIGVFAGVQFTDYQQLLMERVEGVHAQIGTGNAIAMLSNRVSYYLNLCGPSETLDTACSSSLIALHRAVRSIQAGECELAIAGGVNLILTPHNFLGAGKLGILSPDGKCKTFDKNANGYVKGEGVGALLLKPLSKAEEDNDHIYAVIRSSGENHGGKANTLTSPNPDAQAALIVKTYEDAGIDPSTISYIEAHGTGTNLGDPVEVEGLKKAFRELYAKSGKTVVTKHCGLGSVKTNMGHLEPASGIGGILKLVLSMQHGKIPGLVHFKELNPYIDIEDTPFYIVDKTKEWERLKDENGREIPRRAGVSSFGFGGANAHVVLEEYRRPASAGQGQSQSAQLFVLSAKNRDRLREYAADMAAFLGNEEEHDLADITYTLQVGREHMEERLAVVASDKKELAEKLGQFGKGKTDIPGFYIGNTKTDGAKAGLLIEGRAGEEFIRIILQDRDWDRLAALWTSGVEIDWTLLYNGMKQRRISLPTYPFAKDRYWIPQPGRKAETFVKDCIHGLHPLIDSNESTLEEQSFKKVFTGSEFYLKDHGGVLPGVVYLEMVRAAGNLASRQYRVAKLKNVVLAAPIVVNEAPKEVHVGLYPGDGHVDYTVSTSEEDGQRTVHSQGRVIYEEHGAYRETEYMDIANILGRCRGGKDSAAEYYAHIESFDAHFGDRFKGIQEFYYNSKEAIARVGILPELERDCSDFVLHPTLMDGGFQAAVAFAYKTTACHDTIYLPFVMGEVEIIAPQARIAYAYVKGQDEGNDKGEQAARFDIVYLDVNGKIVVKIKDFSIRALGKSAETGFRTGHQTVPVACYRDSWKIMGIEQAQNLPEAVLLFDTGEDVFNILISSNVKVVLVKPGTCFKDCGKLGFEIRPGNGEDCSRLIDELQGRGLLPKDIVFMWDRMGAEDEKDAIKAVLNASIYTVFHIVRKYVERKPVENVHILVAYTCDAAKKPFYAAISGFGKAVRLENRNFSFKTIDIRDTSGTPEDRAALLLSELERADGVEEIRYEGKNRLVKGLEEFEPEAVDEKHLPLKENGVYLVTGGAGGLGLIFAQYLSCKRKAKIILTGRSPLSPEKEVKIKALEASGAEIVYIRADISVREDVETLVSKVKERFNEINGVIHSAGVIRDSFISKKVAEEVDAVLAPKVYGAIYLDEALKDENLDFFVLFSSTTAAVGNVGQSDYAYANSFLDQFALVRSGIRPGKTLSIRWPLWKEGGMRVDEQAERLITDTYGMKPINSETGIDIFEKGLMQPSEGFMALSGDLRKLKKMLGLTEKANEAHVQKDASSQPAQVDDGHLTEYFRKDIIRIISEILRIREDEIGLDGDMDEFGFDSLSFTELANKINERFGLDVTPAVFFGHSTPGSIVQNLLDSYGDGINRHYQNSVEARPQQYKAGTDVKEEAQILVEKHFNTRFQPIALTANPAVHEGMSKDMPIAIIGMSGVMPQSENLEEFWRNLENEMDMMSEIPEDRWDWRKYYGDSNTGTKKTKVKWGGFMKEIDKFDPLFFNISPMEAEFMDPQARLAIEAVWNAIEDAGYKASDLSGTKTAVYIGVTNEDYKELLVENKKSVIMTQSLLVNRISYIFNLRGPSEPVDTACSSSLVAVHRAVEAIRSGNCGMAIAGGVNIIARPDLYISQSSYGMLSLDGRCKTFDKSANGYARGEGVGIILLKPLHKAQADNDHIYGVIRGTAVNHGGHGSSFTAPNASAQAEVLVSAWENSGIDPSTVTYIETHGTGTALGDPIEIEGLKMAFKELLGKWGKTSKGQKHIALGTVKTNIGHLESAAGIAGIIKVLLSMKNAKLPAVLHFKELNPYIQLDGSPFYIQDKTCEWKRLTGENKQLIPRRAGVSSFGIGGVNAHVVIEEYESSLKGPASDDGDAQIIVLSAKSEERLKVYAIKLCEFLKRHTTDGEVLPVSEDKFESILGDLLDKASVILNIGKEEIGASESMTEYGFDAVSITKFADAVSEKYGIDVTPSMISECGSIKDIAQYLVEACGDRPAIYAPAAAKPLFSYTGKNALTMRNVAYTLQIGREEMEYRLAVVASGIEELVEKLKLYSDGRTDIENLYTGIADKGKEVLGLLIDSEEGQEFVRNVIKKGKLSKIAQLWTSGIKIEWELLYASGLPGRVSLPTYPFEKERYWFAAQTEHEKILEEQNRPVSHDSWSLDDSEIIQMLEMLGKGELTAEEAEILLK
jgi:polyketide synthase PksN